MREKGIESVRVRVCFGDRVIERVIKRERERKGACACACACVCVRLRVCKGIFPEC